jgi:type II secretory pathway pseudopilin PulG
MTSLFRSANQIQRPTPMLAHPLIRHWLRHQNGSASRASIAGLTLLEALVAMIIISVIISVITPPVFIAVATRVYQRKTEQALNIAQQEIDSVRRTVSSGDYDDKAGSDRNYTKVLPPTIANKAKLVDHPAPNDFCPPTASAPYCTSTTTAIKRDESSGGVGGSADNSSIFYVQVFRTEGSSLNTTAIPGAFRLAVRVYEENPKEFTLGTAQAPLTFTTGTARRKGANALPLAVLYTEVTRGDSGKDSLNSIKKYSVDDKP